jgi:hypothetical protein
MVLFTMAQENLNGEELTASYQPINSGDEWNSNKSVAESLQLEFIVG